MDEISKELAKQGKGVLTEVYKDGLGPSVKPIGTMLSYLPRTIRLAFSRWEKWIINGEESLALTAELLREKIKAIPEEKICEPEPYVAIPAIQQISYCENSHELRELYANLLAASMNIDTKWDVHPSFVDIIKQLNPDEAKLLKVFDPTFMGGYPLIDVRLVEKDIHKGYRLYITNFTDVGLNTIQNKKKISAYIDNLARLKLIEIPIGKTLVDETKYQKLKENKILTDSIDSNFTLVFNVEYDYKAFRLTNFGQSFIMTCC